MTNVYGGDEVGAVVMDIGHYSTKVGYAGEDSPRSEVPSAVAVHDVPTELAAKLDLHESGATGALKERKYYIDTTRVTVPRSGQEIKSILKDGVVDDFDLLEKMMEYIYDKHINSKADLHPLMFSEASWSPKNVREKLGEMIFEKFNVPALHLASHGMLCAFSTGRPTGIVFDSGAHHSSAIPVFDGHVLNRAIVKTPYGGDYITGFCYKQLLTKQFEINPYYLIKSKEAVPPGQPAKWTKRTNLPDGLHQSWINYMLREELRNYKQAVLKVFDVSYDPAEAVTMYDPVEYHFPDGYNLELPVDDQFQIMEQFFDADFKMGTAPLDAVSAATPAPPSSSTAPNLPRPSISYTSIILQSIAKCDIDIRPALLSSVILAGGNTLFPGFTDRITNDLMAVAPQNLRVKVVPNNSAVERKYAAWIGGSILASLGTFQQLWTSKVEYDEYGKGCVDPEFLREKRTQEKSF